MNSGFFLAALTVTVLSGALASTAGRTSQQSRPRLDRSNLLVYADAAGEVRPVKTRGDWRKRRASVIAGMEQVMGALPGREKRCPLDVRIEHEADCGTYVRRLISYTAEPGCRVPAYLLVPKRALAGGEKVPAVLCLHPTNHQIGHKVVVGLGGAPNRQYAQELVERGYVTLAPPYPLLADYHPDLRKFGYRSGTMKAIWDNIRGIDLLESLSFVKRGGVGAIGHSLGGHNAVYTAVFDPRIAAVVSSCGLDSFVDYMNGDIRGWTSERYMPGLFEYRDRLADVPFDFHELIGALAPRHCFISAPKGDTNFKWESVKRIADSARPVYELYGAGDRLLVEHPEGGHDFPDPMREIAYALFDKVLRVGNRTEDPTKGSHVLHRVVDLDLAESAIVELKPGKRVTVRLVEVKETRDEVCGAVRSARVQVELNGKRISLDAGPYNLPVAASGVRIDCPITKGYYTDTRTDAWGLVKQARLRLWPAGSPLLEPGSFTYPARQRWFATMTQMANEPVYVDGGEAPGPRKIYYHYGLDIGGSEGLVDVVAATDGVVVSAGTETLPEHRGEPVDPRYDVVYVLDGRGWYYRYSHLKTIDVRLGERIRMGRKIGLLGKEGGSGGWSHLHFDIHSRQPSGKWGIEEGYAFLWEAYLREYRPPLVAVARPHQLVWGGSAVTLDGTKSWGDNLRYEWTLTNGVTARGPKVERVYDRPGFFSEILKITDAKGREDYDFAIVQVIDRANPQPPAPTIHPNYAPTFGIQPGDPVTFKVRTFGTQDGEERWDFGDGTAPVTVKSDGNVKPLAQDGYAMTMHRFEKSGLYVVRVERANKEGVKAIGHLKVVVGQVR